MTGRDEDRGVSEVIGFIIIFGFLVIAFTIYQGIAVPDQNRGVEFNHNQQVQGDVQELRNALLTTASTGSPQAVDVALAARYPDRTLARNFGATAGSIADVPVDGAGEIAIANATARDEYSGAQAVWNGTTRSFATSSIVYQPFYSFYSNAPITYLDNVLVANRFAETNLTVTDQVLVDDERITLISVVGDLSEGGDGTATVELESASTATNTIAVRNETDPIVVTLPTHLPAETWNETLSDEYVSEGGHVQDVRDGGSGAVEIVLEPDVSYELRLARVDVGGADTSEPAEYLAVVDRPHETVAANASYFITVEARDQFNNPVTGESIEASIIGNGTFANDQDEIDVTTSAGGAARVRYTAPAETGEEAVRFEIGDGDGAGERVWTNVTVGAGAGGGGSDGGDDGTSEINPSSGQKTLVYVNSTVKSGGSDEVTVYLNNTASSDITIDRARFQFYSINNPSSDKEPPAAFELNGERIAYLGDFTSVGGVTIAPGAPQPITLHFENVDGGAFTTAESDFFIITIETDSGDRITYYIGIVRTNN